MMDGINLPNSTDDLFITLIVAVVSALLASIISKSVEGKIPVSNAIPFTLSFLVICGVTIFVWYNVVGILIFVYGMNLEKEQGCRTAIPTFKSSVNWNPNFIPARWSLVSCAFETTRIREMFLIFDPLQGPLYDSPSYWTQLAYLYAGVDSYQQMYEATDRALLLDPVSVGSSMALLGEYLHRQFEFSHVERLMRLVRTADMQNVDALFWLAWSLYEQRNYQDALAHFVDCLRTNDANRLARCEAGTGFSLLALGRYQEAREAFRLALQYDPNQTDVIAAVQNLP